MYHEYSIYTTMWINVWSLWINVLFFVNNSLNLNDLNVSMRFFWEVSIYLQIHVFPKIIIQVVVSSQRILDPWNSWSKKSPDHSPTEGEGMDTNWVYGFVGAVAARLAKRAAVDGQRPIKRYSQTSSRNLPNQLSPQKMPPILGGSDNAKVWWFWHISLVIVPGFYTSNVGGWF